MKMKYLKTSLIISFIINSLYSQVNMGTIVLNDNYTATCKFPNQIGFVAIGNNPIIGNTPEGTPVYKNFELFQDGNILVLKIKNLQVPKTSITVTLSNNDIYFGVLSYGDNPKIYYDYTNQPGVTKVEAKPVNDSLKESNKIMDRIKYVMSLNKEYEEGVEDNKILIAVVNINNDDSYTYFKILFFNKSGSDYTIRNVGFKYVEGKSKGLLRKESIIEERKRIAYETGEQKIKAYSSRELGFAIPLYSVGESGDLCIQFIEKNGTRNLKIEIPSKTLLKVKKLDF